MFLFFLWLIVTGAIFIMSLAFLIAELLDAQRDKERWGGVTDTRAETVQALFIGVVLCWAWPVGVLIQVFRGLRAIFRALPLLGEILRG